MINLIKNKWNDEDIQLFIKYLETLKENDSKILWTKKIVNTKIPVLAVPSNVLKDIAKEICKGNYLSFLDYNLDNYHENTIINAYLINRIKDINLLEHYLDKYTLKIDNWASCDALKFKYKNNYFAYLDLSRRYIQSELSFRRRVGVIILFSLISKEYLKNIFEIVDKLFLENDYYVNMAVAWLLCECFIKLRDETLKYIKTHKINDFVLHKMVSKCRDSYRVSEDDKIMLKNINGLL